MKAGAPPEILTEAHPHIGTFRLVTMVESLRATIEELGGEYRFSTRVDGLDIATDATGERRLRGLHLHVLYPLDMGAKPVSDHSITIRVAYR